MDFKQEDMCQNVLYPEDWTPGSFQMLLPNYLTSGLQSVLVVHKYTLGGMQMHLEEPLEP
jgi:hypothetical protein